MTTTAADWRPVTADVAAIIPMRPGEDDAGNPRPDFSPNSRPTSAQVANVIVMVQAEVIGETGTMPDALVVPADVAAGVASSPAGRVVALGAASYVELSFFPDLQLSGDSPASVLMRRYLDARAALLRTVAAIRAGSAVGDGMASAASPAWHFPAAVESGVGSTPWDVGRC